MRKTILRRLEALEQEHRSREQEKLDSLLNANVYLWTIVLAYYLGDLQSDENPFEANAKLHERYNDAYRPLFAKVGLDFDGKRRSAPTLPHAS
jgi:hypothetical protein